MLSIVTFKWKPADGYRSKFGPETVNVLSRMIKRHYQKPHRFICVTDDATGLEDVEVMSLFPFFDHERTRTATPVGHSSSYPNCYRRLRMFSREVEALFGPRFVCVDLDVVLVADVSPVWDRQEDFVIWGGTNFRTPYNGSMMLMTAGARRQVWEDFDPIASPKAAAKVGYFGSDQAWIAARLGPNERRWGKGDGVYSFRNDIRTSRAGYLPPDARMVIFHGHLDPWMPAVQNNYPWVERHWR